MQLLCLANRFQLSFQTGSAASQDVELENAELEGTPILGVTSISLPTQPSQHAPQVRLSRAAPLAEQPRASRRHDGLSTASLTKACPVQTEREALPVITPARGDRQPQKKWAWLGAAQHRAARSVTIATTAL